MDFSTTELKRYDRHIKLDGFGAARQHRLKSSKVLIAGAGGLGNPIGLYLAGAGIGTIGIADFDVVDVSNLHRQVAFRTESAGAPKVTELITALRQLNSQVEYVAHNVQIDARNVRHLVKNYDLVIDGTDVFNARYLLADACYFENIALLHGAVFKFDAQLILLDRKASTSPCFRCLYPFAPGDEALPACNDTGILNVVTGAVGMLMASEAVKYLTGLQTPSTAALLKYDALNQTIKKLNLKKDPDCPLCGKSATIFDVADLPQLCLPAGAEEISWSQAENLIASGAKLIDVRESEEIAEGMVSNAISMPLTTLSSHSLETFGEDVPIVFYCKSGRRSQKALQICADGKRKLFSIAGGIAAKTGQTSLARH